MPSLPSANFSEQLVLEFAWVLVQSNINVFGGGGSDGGGGYCLGPSPKSPERVTAYGTSNFLWYQLILKASTRCSTVLYGVFTP